MPVDAVVPARNEASTVAAVVRACRECRYVRRVIVVDDGSTDSTAGEAAAAGAAVVAMPAGTGSKAHAMEAGVAATDAGVILFVDADCLNLAGSHLDDICRPVVEGRAAMSLGIFDYGRRNRILLRLPPTTGERAMPRWVFESIPPSKLDGYTIELRLNEVIAEGRLPSTARVMRGVTHRTKREKFGWREGYRRTFTMFRDLWRVVQLCRKRSWWFYLRDLTVED